MAKIKKIKDHAGKTEFPVTVADAVLMGNGKTLKGELTELSSEERYNLLSVNNIQRGNNNNNLVFIDFARKLQFYVSDELLSHNLIIGQFGYTENNGTFIYLYDTTDNKYLSKIVLSNSDIDNLTYCSAISANKEYAVEGWFSTEKLKTGFSPKPDEKYGIFTDYNAVVATKTLSEYKLEDRLDNEIDRLDNNIYSIGLTSSTDDDIVNGIVVYINSNVFNGERTYAISNINLTKGFIDIYERDLVNNIWLGRFKKLQFDNNVELYENLNDDVKYIVNVKQLKKLVNENKLTANDNALCALIKPNGILTYLENKINEEKNRASKEEIELYNKLNDRTLIESLDEFNEDVNLLNGVTWNNGSIFTIENTILNQSVYGEGTSYEGWYSCLLPIKSKQFKLYIYCYKSTVTVIPLLYLDENLKVIGFEVPKNSRINNIESDVIENAKYVLIQAPDSIAASGYTLQDWTLFENKQQSIKNIVENIQRTNIYNLSILCVGDSLTAGDYGSEPSGTANVQENNYPKYLSQYLKIPVTNKGYCGYTSSVWWKNVAKTIDYTQYDIMVIMLGTNGGITDTLSTDVEPFEGYENYADTVTGNYCKIIEYALSMNPNLCILICTPPYVDKTKRPHNYNNAVSANEPIKKIAKRYNLPIKDMFYEGGYNDLNTSVMQPIDGLHFGEIGYQRMAVTIGNFIKFNGTFNLS